MIDPDWNEATRRRSGSRRRALGSSRGRSFRGEGDRTSALRSRLRRGLLLVALAAAALALATGGVAGQETKHIGQCQQLTESSTTYVLTEDVSSEATTCFNVPSDVRDVTLEGQGHVVHSAGDPGAAFRYYADGVTVRNVTFLGWRDGVYGQSANGALIDDVHVRNATDFGFEVNDVSDTTIVDSSARYSKAGFYASDASGVSLENVTLRSNDRGIETYGSRNHAVRNSTIADNRGDGATAVRSSLAFESTALRSNSGNELSLGYQGTATGHGVTIGPSDTDATLDFDASSVWFEGVSDPNPVPADNASLGAYFEVGKQSSNPSYDATIRYSHEDAYPVDEDTLEPYVEDGSNWTQLSGATVDSDANEISGIGSDGTFGTFGAFGEPVPYFDVAVDGTPEVVEGEPLTVEADVTNRGAASGTTDVDLNVDGLGTASESDVSVAPGESRTVDLSVDTVRGDNETYDATLETAHTTDEFQTRVLRLPYVELSNVSAGATVPAGENYTVAVNATNLGDLAANQTLTLETTPVNGSNASVNGSNATVRDQVEIDLAGRTREPFDLSWGTGPNDTGNYTVTVSSANESVSRSVWVQVPSNFTVSNVSTTSPVYEGDSVEVTAVVENLGEATATKELNLTVGDTVRASEEVTLAGGENRTVTLSWGTQSGDAGRYNATVASPDDAAGPIGVAVQYSGGGGSIGPTPSDALGVTVLGTNTPVQAGSSLRVTVALSNSAGTPTTETVVLRAGGESRSSREVTVPANGRRTVDLTWSIGSGAAGTYSIAVEFGENSDTTSAVVQGESATSTTDVVTVDPTTPVVEGQPVGVRATIRAGDGGFSGRAVLVSPGGERVDAASLELGAGEQTTVTTTWPTGSGDAGSGVVTVRAGGDAATSPVEVREAPPFDVSLAGTNGPVAAGERLQVEATVASRAAVRQEGYVRLLVDGQRVDGQSVALDSGASRTVTLSWVPEDGAAGQHDVALDVTTDQASTTVSVREGGWTFEAPQWTQSAVEYEPSEQTRHVGGFLWLTLVVGGLGAYVLATRRTPDARLLGVTLLTAAARTATDVLHATIESVTSEPLLALNTLLELYVGLLFLAFAASYVGREPLVDRRSAAGLAVLAVLGTIAVVTDPYGLVFADVTYQQGPFTYVSAETGPLGWAVLSVTLGSLLAAAGLLFQSFLAGTDPAWRPVGVLAGALGLAVVLVGASAVQRGPLPRYDYTGAAVAGFIALASTTLFRQGLQRLKRDARQSLIENLEDPIVIANDARTVLEYNAAAAEVIPGIDEGVRVDELFAEQPSWPTAGESTRLERRRSALFEPDVAATDGGRPEGTTVERRAADEQGDEAVGDADGALDARGHADDASGGVLARRDDGGTDDAGRDDADGDRPGQRSGASEASARSPAAAVASKGEVLRDAEDADDVHYQVVISSVTADTGDALGFTVRFTDVTELKHRTEELRRKNSQLEQVASTISHDLRNPLGVADGYVDLLLDDVPGGDAAAEGIRGGGHAVEAGDVEEGDANDGVDPASIDRHLGPVDRAVGRMDAIIEDILALARSAEPVANTEPVSFRDTVEEAWATVDTHDATLFVESGGTIEADGQRLRRILENLFRNAVEHAGDDAAVVCGVTDDGFYVADDGPGIPEERREDVFEEGYTSSQDGTGLGLAIVAQLASAHGWHVRLDPAYDEGAHFTFGGCDVEPDGDSSVDGPDELSLSELRDD